MLIMMDLGNPAKIFVMVTAFRLNSMMTWDFWLLVLAGVVTLVYLWQARPGAAIGALSILAAGLVVIVEGWMLASLAARPMWGGGLMVVNFLVGAAIAGLGLLALLPGEAAKLRTPLAWALSAGLLLVLAETLTGLVSRDPQVSDEMRILLFGSGAPVFWLHLIAGLIAPLLLLRTPSALTVAAALAVAGVLAEKIWVLAVGQALPWVELPAGSYLPSWVELTAVIGMAGLAALVYMALKRFVLGKLAR
jgi:molybdopterin-containing oxidoreductase family membrane subunit